MQNNKDISINDVILFMNKIIEFMEKNPEFEYTYKDECMMLEFNGNLMDLKDICSHIINHIKEKCLNMLENKDI